jgi:hypothetical protein
MNYNSLNRIYKPKNSKINFIFINIIVLLGTVILWRKDLIYHKFDFGFPILIYIIFSIIGVCISFVGYCGFVASYCWGLFSFFWYYNWLWDSINGVKESESIFAMTLLLGPFVLPPFPFFTIFLSLGIDLLISMYKKRKQ